MKRFLILAAALLLLLPYSAAFADGEATAEPVIAQEGATAEPAEESAAEPTATAEPSETATPVPATPAPTAAPTPTATPMPEATATAIPSEATMPPTATPVDDGTKRVTMGADLTSAQRKAVYKDFGIDEGSVVELKVTNAEERAYLEDLVPDRKIGSVALSCIYIQRLDEGEGLTIEVHNINYCTEDMYKNALVTAGIENAKVIVSAPFPVSGTGALTGVYKAYENMTGESLSALAKTVGAEELVVTGELAEYIGSDEAAKLIGELKKMLDQTQGMSDAEVREEIKKLAVLYNVSLTDQQTEQVLSLVRKLEGLDEGELKTRLTNLANAAKTASDAAGTASRIYESVKGFFSSVGSFLTKLFTKAA